MIWTKSHRADKRALPLADRHYNRQKIGSPQFVPPGSCCVFLTTDADALWVTSAPIAKYVKHAWAGAWVCSLFRNEGRHKASELIRQAVAASLAHYEGRVPELGIVTFIDRGYVRPYITPKGREIYAPDLPTGWVQGGGRNQRRSSCFSPAFTSADTCQSLQAHCHIYHVWHYT